MRAAGAPPERAVPFEGVVLCGGRSRRMGQDKALLPVDGVPMARRVADALQAAGAIAVVAAGGDAPALAAAGLLVRPDAVPGGGPLRPVVDALDAAATPIVVVAACDLLRPDPAALAAVASALAAAPGAHVAVPLVDGVRQWHHAAWHRIALPPLRAAWDDGIASPRRAADRLAVVEVEGVPAAAVADADDPGDLPSAPGDGGHEAPG